MRTRITSFVLVATFLLLITAGASAELKGYPVDIPGTDVNFFLYRYLGDVPPYDDINAIWDNISAIFLQWSAAGANPEELSASDVSIENVDGVIGLYLKDQLIVEVDDFHAEINRATRQQLAEKWASNLRTGVEVFVEYNRDI